MKPRVTPLVLVLLAAGSAACDVTAFSATSGQPPEHSTVVNTYGSDAGDAAVEEGGSSAPARDGGTAVSPLCHLQMQAPATLCNPDEAPNAYACDVVPDAGAPDDASVGAGGAPLACRVLPQPSAVSGDQVTGVTACFPAGPGTGGAACKASSDCAPAFDCVGSTAGACRHYCCAGDGECGADQFCDVQPLSQATTTPVPVCMPIEPPGGCTLLGEGDAGVACPAGQTCAVVREDGTTGCVDTGSAGPGQECDSQHCGPKLTCLGMPGARTCYKLCHVGTMDCGTSATCQGGLPLFQDPTIGVCR